MDKLKRALMLEAITIGICLGSMLGLTAFALMRVIDGSLCVPLLMFFFGLLSGRATT